MIDTLMALWNRGNSGRGMLIVSAFLIICISISLLLATIGGAWMPLFAHESAVDGQKSADTLALTQTARAVLVSPLPTTDLTPAQTPVIVVNPCAGSPTATHQSSPIVAKQPTRWGIGNRPHPTPRATPTPRPRPTQQPTVGSTPSPIASPTPPMTPTPPITPTPLPTTTPSPSPSPLPSPTQIPSPTAQPSPAPSPTVVISPTPKSTSTPTLHPTVVRPTVQPTIIFQPHVTRVASGSTASPHTQLDSGVAALTTNCLSYRADNDASTRALDILRNYVWIILWSSGLCTLFFIDALSHACRRQKRPV